MGTRIIKVHSSDEIASAARQGADELRAGKLVGFATETVYGIAAMASHDGAMQRLRRLKSRPKGPFTVHLACPEDARRYVAKIPHAGQVLMRKGWPGPVTVLLKVGGHLAEKDLQDQGLYKTLCNDDVIGLRCPETPVAQAMISGVKMPIVAPSANLTGARTAGSADEVLAALAGKIDLLIDEGPTRYGRDSTIVSFTGKDWDIVRKGVYDARTVRRLMQWRFLFVCTGNTCRSAMAGGLAKKMLAEKLGCRVGELRGKGVEVVSAGVFASGARPATPEAILAAKERDADISRHRSRKLTTELINSADMIFCMTDFHVDEVRRLAPSASGKVERLDRANTPDPIGGGADIYRRTAERIERALQVVLRKVQL